MKPGRAVGLVILSFLDALVPTLVAFLVVLLSVPYWLDPGVGLLALAGGAAVVAFVGTLTVGTVSYVGGYGPFPATKAAKRVWKWSAWI